MRLVEEDEPICLLEPLHELVQPPATGFLLGLKYEGRQPTGHSGGECITGICTTGLLLGLKYEGRRPMHGKWSMPWMGMHIEVTCGGPGSLGEDSLG